MTADQPLCRETPARFIPCSTVSFTVLPVESPCGCGTKRLGERIRIVSLVSSENPLTRHIYYICQTYNRLGRNACASHKIEARDLYLVLKDIQDLEKTALKDANTFYQRLSSRMERRYMADASQMQKERERLEARNREIDEMFLNLCTDKTKGILSEQRFVKLTVTMEQEQEENQRRLQELLRMLQQSDAQESEVRTFIREIRQYATIQELDETVLNRLISRILVGEAKKIDGRFRKSRLSTTLLGKSQQMNLLKQTIEKS